jgi:hypothetical protein
VEQSALPSENGKTASLVAAAVLLLFGNTITVSRAQNAYPNVGDVPPRPDKPAMTVDEQSKLRKELTEARERQKSQLKLKAGEAPNKATEGYHSR